MHSKVFEIMINGGFVAFPISHKNGDFGSIEESFEEDIHFQHLIPVILKILTINGSITITTD